MLLELYALYDTVFGAKVHGLLGQRCAGIIWGVVYIELKGYILKGKGKTVKFSIFSVEIQMHSFTS